MSDSPPRQIVGDLKSLAVALVVLAALGAAALVDVRVVFVLVGGLAALYLGVLVARRSYWAGVIIWVCCLMRTPMLSLTATSSLHEFAKFVDDGPLFLALVVTLLGLARNRSPLPKMFWYGAALFAFSGIAGGLIFHANPPGFIDGTWLGLKLPVAIFIMTQLRWPPRGTAALITVTFAVFMVQCAIMAVEVVNPTAVHEIFRDAGTNAERGGITSLKGMFGQPVQAAAFSVFVTTLLFCGPAPRRLRPFAVLGVATAAVGLRVKTFVDFIILAMMRSLRSPKDSTRKLTPAIAAGAAAIIFASGASLILGRVTDVVADDDSARKLLYTTGLQIAQDHFPFGTGFGSYASEAASSNYSPVWVEYHMANVWGFRPDKMLFATDAAVATVIGENGLMGVIGMTMMLASLWLLALRLSRGRLGPSWGLAAVTYSLVVIAEGFASPRLYDGFAAASLGALVAIAIQNSPSQDESEAARSG